MFCASLLMLVVTLCIPGLGSGLFGLRAKQSCPVQACTDAHHKRVGEIEERLRFCASLQLFKACVSRVSRLCRGDINYMTLTTLFPKLMENLKCGNVTAPKNESEFQSWFSTKPEPTKPVVVTCQFREGEFTKSQDTRNCGLFGDPHLRTFSEQKQTCVVKGAWPLIRNKFLTVMVSNVELMPGSRTSQSVTATNKIVVILREQKKGCVEQKIYRAETDSLPAVFLDGTWATGPASCPARIVQVIKGSLIHINLCYIKTKIVIRQVGKYLTFHIRIPEDIVSSSSRGLCVVGCPERERIDYKEVLSLTAAQLQERKITVRYSRQQATDICNASDAKGFYLDSCVFDLMMTGDKNFTVAAKKALDDAFELDSEGTVKDIQNYAPATTPTTSIPTTKSRACILQSPFLVSFVIPFLFCFIQSRVITFT